MTMPLTEQDQVLFFWFKFEEKTVKKKNTKLQANDFPFFITLSSHGNTPNTNLTQVMHTGMEYGLCI